MTESRRNQASLLLSAICALALFGCDDDDGTKLVADVGAVDLGVVEARSDAIPASVVFRNTGTSAVDTPVALLPGDDNSAEEGGFEFLPSTTCAGRLEPGGECVVDLRFVPASAGPYTATLSVGDSRSVSLSAKAYATVNLEVIGDAEFTVASAPDDMACAESCTGQFTTRELILKPSQRLVTWSGCTQRGDGTCAVSLDAADVDVRAEQQVLTPSAEIEIDEHRSRVATTSDGGVLLGGDGVLSRLSPSLAPVWSVDLDIDRVFDMTALPDGRAALLGQVTDEIGNGLGPVEMRLLSADGGVEAALQPDPTKTGRGYDGHIASDEAGAVYVAATTEIVAGADATRTNLTRYSPQGTREWSIAPGNAASIRTSALAAGGDHVLWVRSDGSSTEHWLHSRDGTDRAPAAPQQFFYLADTVTEDGTIYYVVPRSVGDVWSLRLEARVAGSIALSWSHTLSSAALHVAFLSLDPNGVLYVAYMEPLDNDRNRVRIARFSQSGDLLSIQSLGETSTLRAMSAAGTSGLYLVDSPGSRPPRLRALR